MKMYRLDCTAKLVKSLLVLLIAAIPMLADNALAVEGRLYVGVVAAPVLADDTRVTLTDPGTGNKQEFTYKHDAGAMGGVLLGVDVFDHADNYTYCRFDFEFDYQYLPVTNAKLAGQSIGGDSSATRWMIGSNIYGYFPLTYDEFPRVLTNTSGFVQLGVAGGREVIGRNEVDISYIASKFGFGVTQKISGNVAMDAAYVFTILQGDDRDLRSKGSDQKLVLGVRYLF